jgi:uncharacterized protein
MVHDMSHDRANRTGVESRLCLHPSSLAMIDPETVIADTRRWLQEAVIGLNLCPFAKAVHIKGQIAWRVSQAKEPAQLAEELQQALRELASTDADKIDTLLLIHPLVLNDFEDYNDFLDVVDAIVDAESLEGVLQVASFHPQYQFAGSASSDRSNYTNRSPWPMLHLLREDSVSRAVDSLPNPDAIYERNVELLEEMPEADFDRIWPTAKSN